MSIDVMEYIHLIHKLYGDDLVLLIIHFFTHTITWRGAACRVSHQKILPLRNVLKTVMLKQELRTPSGNNKLALHCYRAQHLYQ